ncbi:MltR family transcriptional regulator [Moritella marina]|uniref:MltR family transcriptional regulator n=1 Tax=Moritella marina TaxID=90736 RepID=UPI003703C8B6
MPNVKNFEADVLEALSETDNAHEFSMVCYDVLEDAVDILLQNVFRKDDYAVKYAVSPLLDNDGPLWNLDIRLKLLFGLGLLSQSLYQDIEKLTLLKGVTQEFKEALPFTSAEFIACLNEISVVTRIMPIELDASLFDTNMPDLYAMQMNRQKERIRSILILAITDVVKELHRKTPLS